VPADPSSSIPSGLAPLCEVGPLRPAEPPHLLTYLATVTDPRARAGRRYQLVAILGLAAAAVLAGARSITAIAEWAADAPQPVRAALSARRDPLTGRWAVPTEATIRRTLARLDAEALAAPSAPSGSPTDETDIPRERRACPVVRRRLHRQRRLSGEAEASPTPPVARSVCHGSAMAAPFPAAVPSSTSGKTAMRWPTRRRRR